MINVFGKYPSRVKKEFIVTGLDSYLDSVEKIKSDQYEKIVEKASSLIWLTGWGYYEDSKYICNIFYYAKEQEAHGVSFLGWCELPVGNAICFVFEHPEDGYESTSKLVYTVIALKNLLIDSNGDLKYSKYDMFEYNVYENVVEIQNELLRIH